MLRLWLPYPNFAVSAMVLSRAHLGTQCVEARIAQTAVQQNQRGPNLDEVDRWRDHVLALMLYGDCMIREARRRGDRGGQPLMLARHAADMPIVPSNYIVPPWLGDDGPTTELHRDQLYLLDPEWYGQWRWQS